jgi:hypothetical protein
MVDVPSIFTLLPAGNASYRTFCAAAETASSKAAAAPAIAAIRDRLIRGSVGFIGDKPDARRF